MRVLCLWIYVGRRGLCKSRGQGARRIRRLYKLKRYAEAEHTDVFVNCAEQA